MILTTLFYCLFLYYEHYYWATLRSRHWQEGVLMQLPITTVPSHHRSYSADHIRHSCPKYVPRIRGSAHMLSIAYLPVVEFVNPISSYGCPRHLKLVPEAGCFVQS